MEPFEAAHARAHQVLAERDRLYFDEALQSPFDVFQVMADIDLALPLERPRLNRRRRGTFGPVELDSAPCGMALTLRLGRVWPSLTLRLYLQPASRHTAGWDLYWHVPRLDVGLVVVL